MAVSFPHPVRLASFYFAFFAYSAAYVAYFPLYLAGRGLNAAEIAFVLALPGVARIFAPAAWGWIADRHGAQRGIVVLGCAMMLACFAALPYVSGVDAFATLIAGTGIFSAGALPLVEAITLASLPGGPGRYGPVRLWGSVGFIVVLLAGGMWLDVGSIDVLPASLVMIALAALLVAIGLPKGTRHATPPPLRLSLPSGAAPLLAAGFCMAVAHGALYAFLTLHLQQVGYGGTFIGVLWTLGVVAEIFVFAFLPALFRRYALSSILVVSFLCAGLRFMAIAWVPGNLWILAAAQLLHAATFGSFHAASIAVIHRIFPDTARARGQSLFSSVSYGGGGAAGTLLAGWAWQAAGPGFAFSLAALAGLLGAYFAYLLKRAGL